MHLVNCRSTYRAVQCTKLSKIIRERSETRTPLQIFCTHRTNSVVVRSTAAFADGRRAPVIGIQGVDHDSHSWGRGDV